MLKTFESRAILVVSIMFSIPVLWMPLYWAIFEKLYYALLVPLVVIIFVLLAIWINNGE